METIDDTGFGGIRIIQDSDGFRYGIDAVLLADFAQRCCPDADLAVELGCGNGIVSLLLAEASARRQVTGIEFQETAVSLARRSCELNHMQQRVSILHHDISELRQLQPQMGHAADLVVSNPPYITGTSGLAASRESVRCARQETTADLEDFIRTAAWLLREKGTLCLVHRPARLVDIFFFCRSYRLEPKKICFVHPREGLAPNIVLLQCVLGGGRELKYEEPIVVYDTQGRYSPQILRIYRKSED